MWLFSIYRGNQEASGNTNTEQNSIKLIKKKLKKKVISKNDRNKYLRDLKY